MKSWAGPGSEASALQHYYYCTVTNKILLWNLGTFHWCSRDCTILTALSGLPVGSAEEPPPIIPPRSSSVRLHMQRKSGSSFGSRDSLEESPGSTPQVRRGEWGGGGGEAGGGREGVRREGGMNEEVGRKVFVSLRSISTVICYITRNVTKPEVLSHWYTVLSQWVCTPAGTLSCDPSSWPSRSSWLHPSPFLHPHPSPLTARGGRREQCKAADCKDGRGRQLPSPSPPPEEEPGRWYPSDYG